MKSFLGPGVDPRSFLETPHDRTVPHAPAVVERLNAFRELLEEHLRTVVANANEIDAPSYSMQARGEAIATLIALRELWELFPELWPP